ncbi:ral guanine nucleotide dissociation stimulator isoform X2 [Condylostylus longicornis]|uniref:ral guanine nucleotide dissociation stimulator isoform X2 n=1 Tax=Condylostylus longicornis TaxID=2530218 RepID=UPI00244DA23F|nr:ral guanine nucleotide dissociation stimulator isoform X2 [Condylostylus longicornis]
MFCPANEAFQNITEKTKLIAQKCSQQIRIATAGTLSSQQQQQQQQQQQNQQCHQQKSIQSTLEVPNQYDPYQQQQHQNQQKHNHYMSISLPTSPAGYKNFIDIENIDGNLCSTNYNNSRIDNKVGGGSSNSILDDKYSSNNISDKKNFVSDTNIITNNENNRNLNNGAYWKRRTSDTNVNSNQINNGNGVIQGTQSLSKAATTKLGSNFNKYFYSCTGGTLRNLAKKYQQQKNACSSNNQSNTTNTSTTKWYVKPTWRFWGEEREKDAIFTVYLKKVRYHRPIMISNQDSDDEISHLEWETVRVRFVKAASLPRLVEALATNDGELESTFIMVFLTTYRTFSNAKEILDLLYKRYDTLTELILRIKEKHSNNISSSSASSIASSSSINSHNNSFHLHYQNGDISSDTRIWDDITKPDIPNETNYDSEDLLTKHEQHKKTLVSALHVWLDGFPEDWNEENLRHLLAFSSKRLPNSDLHMKVLHRYERCIRLQAQQNHHHHYHHTGSLSGNHHALPWMEQTYSDLSEQFSGLCLAPAFRGTPGHLLQAYRFPHIPVKHFAEQLTRMDTELFKKVIPHQCLGATWTKRDQHEADTVVATVNQFNAVSSRVISSILIEPKLKSQERALNIATWIEIAQELRLQKNFSSLKAIVTSLESQPIFRLTKTWNALPKDKCELFRELSRIFAKDMSEILQREGTAKIADTVGENDKHMVKVLKGQDQNISHGTIPFLGAFLSELTYIDAYYPSYIEENLINFSKRRKEFEVLAQIKLLQGAANVYNFPEDHHFDRWFASMLVLDDREAHALSCQIEPPSEPRKLNSNNNNNNINNNNNSSPSSVSTVSNIIGHRKTDSVASNSSSGAGSHTFYYELNNGSNSISFTESNYSRNNSLGRDTIPPNSVSMMSASSSASNISIDSSNSGGHQKSSCTNNSKSKISNGKLSSTGIVTNDGTPIINAQLVQSPGQKNSTPDFYIIRVTLEVDNSEEMDGVVLYKSIMLGNNEHTPQVIKNAMMKLDIEGDPDQFTLAQVLPDKELVMPPNANVYYAVNTQYNLNFILRRKKK